MVPAHPGQHHQTAFQPFQVGSQAPNFRLPWMPDQTIELHRQLAGPVILAFYSNDWSPASEEQLTSYQETLAQFQRLGTSVFGISVDSVWSHLVFARRLGLTFPLLSDFQPRGRVAGAYSVYRSNEGTSESALFLIDPGGRIAWSSVAPAYVNSGVDGILTALEKLRSTTHQS